MESFLNESDYRKKSEIRVKVSRTLLGLAFGMFTFIAALNPDMLTENVFLALQITMAIPFLISSIFVRSRLSYEKRTKRMADYGLYTFLIAYTFLINSIGIMLASTISFYAALGFFLVNIFGALLYSYIDIIEHRDKLETRIKKDWIFILGVIVLGILPSAFAV